MKIKTVLRQGLLWILLSLLIPNPSYAKPADTATWPQVLQNPILCVNSTPQFATFPNIALDFRLLDTNLTPVNLSANSDLRIAENNRTPVPLTTITQHAAGMGLNYSIIVDKGNRTSQSAVRSILQLISGYSAEKIDTVQIYTNDRNETQAYYPGPGGNNLTQAISNYPTYDSDQPGKVSNSTKQVLSVLETNASPCQAPRLIVFIMGDDALTDVQIMEYAQRARKAYAKVIVFHVSRYGAYNSRSIYEELARQTGGIYQAVFSSADDIKPVMDNLMPLKQTYSATYKTNFGPTGLQTHTLTANYQGANIMAGGFASYDLELRPPKVEVQGETVISRLVKEKTATGSYTYDFDLVNYVLHVTWEDAYPRSLASTATILVNDGINTNEIKTPLLARADGSYAIDWNVSEIVDLGPHTLQFSVAISDEFENQGTSAPLEISLTNIKETPWPVYILYILSGLILIMIVVIVLLWNKIKALPIAKKSGEIVKTLVGEIRKTIVGGRRGKPLATLKVLEGPPSMQDQDLKVFTESVKLGRNPQLADLVFYGPEASTTVSGLHARLERVGGVWRIVALSDSRNETFVDDQPIPFHEPFNISNGQKIRLGYFAQQPVILQFSAPASIDGSRSPEEGDAKDEAKTDVIDTPDTPAVQDFFGRRPKKKAPETKKTATDTQDSVFDEFRK